MSDVKRYDNNGMECSADYSHMRFALASDFDALQQRCREANNLADQWAEKNESLQLRINNLEAIHKASIERSGQIKSVAGALGWTADREDGPLDFLIERAQRCRQLETTQYGSGRLQALRDERDSLKFALDEWLDKTDWVQQAISKADLPIRYIGMHRADVMSA